MKSLPFLLVLPLAHAGPITFDNVPLGSLEKPLLLRTYVPDPGLDPAIFSQHGTGRTAPKYNPGQGRDVPGEEAPIDGIPAAIAVNFGPALSYVFDTTECRLLYAWQGGFLDMTPYWGDPDKGNRRSFDYVPRLSGTLFHKASAAHPVTLDGKSLSEVGTRDFTGYQLKEGVPTFIFTAGDHRFTLTVTPSEESLSYEAVLTGPADATLGYRGIEATGKGSLSFTVNGSELGNYQGYERDLKIETATIAAGESLFANYGCIACHSLDGSASHGPTLAGLAGSERQITGLEAPVVADADYLLESIKEPNAKIVEGYPPNYMPPFVLPEVEYEALILFIQSIPEAGAIQQPE